MKKYNFLEPIKIKVEKYPDINSVYRDEGDDIENHKDFFSFEDGVSVEDETVQRWVNECVQDVLDNPEHQYCYCASGNTLVMVTRGREEINVFVSRSHMDATIPLYEPTYEETL